MTYWYELIGNFLGLPIENPDLECLADNDIFILGIETSTGGCQNPKLFSFSELLATPSFCESVQDCVGDAIAGYDYNDALNTWLQENPLTNASNVTFTPTAPMVATNVQTAITELQTIVNNAGYTSAVSPVANTPLVITHNLNRPYPHVTVYDDLNQITGVEVTYIDPNNVSITSTQWFTGNIRVS